MKTIKIQAYSINELTKEAQQRAIEANRETNVNYDGWHDYIFEQWTDTLERLGYTDTNIQYSGFWSQGDGACFTATVDIAKWLKAHKLAKKYKALYSHADEMNIVIVHRSNYCYSTSTTVEEEFGINLPDKAQPQIDAVLKYIEQEREELGNTIYKELEKGYEGLTTDESVKESIEANDMLFTSDGYQQVYL